MAYTVTLLRSGCVTHDVLRLTTTRPEEFEFTPGQGVRLGLAKAGWEKKKRPFTPTSLREDGVLEFTVKIYDDHDGVTRQIRSLQPGDTLEISNPFGSILHQGPGVFIAGGAGITPFLAQLRTLAAEGKLDGHSLLFSNRTPNDVIEEHELRHYLGDRCVFTCTRENRPGYLNQRIDQDFLAEHIINFDQYFYVCGSRPFTREINEALQALGASPESLIFEK